MTIKSIILEWRKPCTKYEKGKYGVTEIHGSVAKVFIDKDQCSNQLVDTFFHEMAHVFLGFHKHSKHMSRNQEEYLATKVGNLVSALLK